MSWPPDPDDLPCEIGPDEAFSDEADEQEAPKEPRTGIVITTKNADKYDITRRLFNSLCCGWPEPPTPEEFYAAVHAEKPDERQRVIVDFWISEARPDDWIAAKRRGGYSWRALAKAARKTGKRAYRRWRTLNMFASKPELIPDEWRPWIHSRWEIPGRGMKIRKNRAGTGGRRNATA